MISQKNLKFLVLLRRRHRQEDSRKNVSAVEPSITKNREQILKSTSRKIPISSYSSERQGHCRLTKIRIHCLPSKELNTAYPEVISQRNGANCTSQARTASNKRLPEIRDRRTTQERIVRGIRDGSYAETGAASTAMSSPSSTSSFSSSFSSS